MPDFDDAFQWILKIEQGYVNDPNDPGGETKYGISKRQYPDLDIKNLTTDQAKQIYKRDYWDTIYGDKLPYRIAIVLFDAKVNGGYPSLIRDFLGTTKNTLNNLLITIQRTGEQTVVENLFEKRVKYYINLNKPEYLSGWMKRLVWLALYI